jgi:hypothetical protein
LVSDVFDFANGQRKALMLIFLGVMPRAPFAANHVFNRKTYLVIQQPYYNDYNFTFNAAQNNFQVKLASGNYGISV